MKIQTYPAYPYNLKSTYRIWTHPFFSISKTTAAPPTNSKKNCQKDTSVGYAVIAKFKINAKWLDVIGRLSASYPWCD